MSKLQTIRTPDRLTFENTAYRISEGGRYKMKFIELHYANGDDSYFLNFDKVTLMQRVITKAKFSWVEGGTDVETYSRQEETEIETPDATFYCQETPEEIIQKIAEAEKCERGCIDDRKDEVDDFLSEIMKW